MHATRWLAAGAGLAGAGYVANALVRFGHATRTGGDPLADRFMAGYEIADRHEIVVVAPADTTLQATRAIDLLGSRTARLLVRARRLIFRQKPRKPNGKPALAHRLVEDMTAAGWRVLAEIPGREIVLGTATKPWAAASGFRPIEPEDFAAFAEPDYVKLVWTLRAEPQPDGTCVLRSETRGLATDVDARRKFRWYWAVFSAGISLSRVVLLRSIKAAAERGRTEVDQRARVVTLPS